jgi:hypothetical protein
LVIEGSGSRFGSGSGFIPLTNGSGFGSKRPKNTVIGGSGSRRPKNTDGFGSGTATLIRTLKKWDVWKALMEN